MGKANLRRIGAISLPEADLYRCIYSLGLFFANKSDNCLNEISHFSWAEILLPSYAQCWNGVSKEIFLDNGYPEYPAMVQHFDKLKIDVLQKPLQRIDEAWLIVLSPFSFHGMVLLAPTLAKKFAVRKWKNFLKHAQGLFFHQ